MDEKTGQVLVQVSEKYFRPTEVQRDTTSDDEWWRGDDSSKSYPKEKNTGAPMLNALEMSYTDYMMVFVLKMCWNDREIPGGLDTWLA